MHFLTWSQLEERKGLFRCGRSGFGQQGEWQDTEGNHAHTPINLPVKKRPQSRRLDRHGSSTSALPTPQRPVPVEHVTQDLKHGFKLPELGESLQKICLREISFNELMEIPKGWNLNRKCELLEERESKIRSNKATIKAMKEKWIQKDHSLTPSGSQEVDQASSPVASHSSKSRKAGFKSHHYSQFQEASRRRQGSKGKGKTTFSKRKK
ncbi:hypothetical protein O181_076292 [Austropuccinia psidii MF-1]|uniref:Uncharacterized protein n=1 Tax=Austropuccinia psidii MF-1 TaxID=1389203 RepID=A0A9Q3IDN2_9BASI|nr:hypothetical protein [Austropuccinia psidii MF-1]